ADKEPDIAGNPNLKLLRKHRNVTDAPHAQKFVVKPPDPKGSGRMIRCATPLLLALVLIAFADLVFAVASVPGHSAITPDPYRFYTSNIFAILGLRALYFALAAMVHRFHYLKCALSLVLIFIGAKIFYNQFYGKLDPLISLSVTFALLL